MKRSFTLALTLTAIALSWLTCSANMAANNDLYDWTVRIKTQHLERQLKFKGSQLQNKVDRLDVDTYIRDEESEANPYESYWYAEGKPMGLELFHEFPVTAGRGVCIKVTHAEGSVSEDEIKASANAILRVWVDAQLNSNAVIVVRVPDQSFYSIISYLKNQGLAEYTGPGADQMVNLPMTLLIQAEASGQRERLQYQ